MAYGKNMRVTDSHSHNQIPIWEGDGVTLTGVHLQSHSHNQIPIWEGDGVTLKSQERKKWHMGKEYEGDGVTLTGGEFPSYDEVTHLLDEANKGDTEVKETISKLHESLLDVQDIKEADIMIWADITAQVNKHATSAFNGLENTFQSMSPTYIEALSKYRTNVINTLRDTWSLSLSHKKLKDIKQNSILKHLDSVTACVELYLTPEEDTDITPEPLLTSWLLDYIWNTLTKM
ncbi:hypothetical protein BDR07DRAFT_1381552 [Suillus spraguei]|nr:hypothetical protein BDR07DRAFT_1381552 [Suillus spraguei]